MKNSLVVKFVGEEFRAGAFSTWLNQARAIFCFFNNNQAGYAAHDALRLKEMIQ